MRRRHPSSEHAEAVSRRLATLSAEIAAMRPGPGADAPESPAAPGVAWDGVYDHDGHTRVRGGEASSQPVGAVPGPGPGAAGEAVWVPSVSGAGKPVVLRAPGRHAHRSSVRRSVPGWLGLALVGSPAQLAVVALVVVVALSGTGWVLWGGRAVEETSSPLADGAPEFSAPAAVAGGGERPGTDATAADGSAGGGAVQDGAVGLVTVDVAGKVRRPGIVQLPAGSRVVDALEAAGGARRGVDLSPLNLARVLVDGEQVLVGTAPASGSPAAAGAPGQGALVNINSADQTLLETLPGVGPVTAGAIISWRTTNGPFSAVEELVEVDGIGEATLAKLSPLVTV